MSNQQKVTALSFDASGIAPQAAFDVIPAGWYLVEITDAEVKATRGKSGGTRANFEFTVTAGDYKGRKVFGGINVKNANPQAQEIGQKELSAICHATGIINVSDLAQFIGKQLQVKVKVRKATDADKEQGYEDRNEPSGYKALEGAAPGGAPAAMPPAFAGVPAAPVAPAAVPPPIAEAVSFPPAGWAVHPSAPGWYFNTVNPAEMLAEADLRAKFAAPVAAPVAMTPPPVAAPVAPVAPVVEFPPAGWLAHPSAPGWFYNSANPAEMKDEAALRASLAPVAPVAAPPVPAGPPMPPAAPAAGSPPPWKTPA